jgi:glucuronoarabinoxylan endo-1,4-beta-xylanase
MKKNKLIIFIVAVLLMYIACANSSNEKVDGAIKINYIKYHQQIDGFGGSNAWTRLPYYPDVQEKLVKLLFSRTEGMGFTILRNRIPFRERLSEDENPGFNDGFIVRRSDNTYNYTENADGTKTFNLNWNSWDISSTRNLIEQIQALGEDGPEKLTIMSTPWTPPNNRVTRWKENVTGINERLNYSIIWSRPDEWGRLKRDKYNDYADLLADYVNNFRINMGAPLDILSVQNEPNWKVEYESAYWNGNDLRDFLKVIAQRFPAKGIKLGDGGLGLMIPEFENFNVNFNEMIKPSLDDPQSERILSHIALHQYNANNDSSQRAGSMEFPQILSSGKRFWQTEVSGSGSNVPTGIGISNGLHYGRMIHFDMILAQANAFLYWWLWTNNTNDASFPGALIMSDDDEITAAHRLYVMGQYSRFIRPGWYRIECDPSPLLGRRVYSSAYANPATKEIAIVCINETITELSISIDLSEAEFNKLDIWRTSENEKLTSLGSQKVSRNTVVNLAPMSITTFYGTVK